MNNPTAREIKVQELRQEFDNSISAIQKLELQLKALKHYKEYIRTCIDEEYNKKG